MSKITFLTDRQVFDNKKLPNTFRNEEDIFTDYQIDVFKKIGPKCEITDFAILLGGYVDYHGYGSWWTKSIYSSHNEINVCNVYDDEPKFWGNYSHSVGARPCLSYSDTKDLYSNRQEKENGIKEVEYGEYPQTVVSKDLAGILETEYIYKNIEKTGKSYTTNDLNSSKLKSHIEYIYKEKKYIRYVSPKTFSRDTKLSDGRNVKNGDIYWIAVEPIKWIIYDSQIIETRDLAICKKIIFAGVQFGGYDFETSNIKKFMEKYFIKEIDPNFRKIEEENLTKSNKTVSEAKQQEVTKSKDIVLLEEIRSLLIENKKEIEELKNMILQQTIDRNSSNDTKEKVKSLL